MGRVETLPDFDGEPHADAFPGSEPRTIRLSLDAGERVDPHRHPGRDRSAPPSNPRGVARAAPDDSAHDRNPYYFRPT